MSTDTSERGSRARQQAAAGWRPLGLLGWMAVTALAAGIGGRFQPGAWYAGLAKPAWTPPDALFAPVWTALYLMMTLAAWLVWLRGGWRGAQRPLALYLAQLTLNTLWSVVFFGLHRIGLAAAVIVALEVLILATTVLFWRRRAAAGALLVPYAAWVAYATALNLALFTLNR